jgi:predicted nucleic acid-binding protein
MSRTALAIETYQFTKADALLVDANVWLYVECPRAQHDWATPTYSRALKRIIAAGCPVFADMLVLSEFVNRYSRLEYGAWKTPGGTEGFKTFRSSDAYPSVAESIAGAVRRILARTQCVESGLTSIDMGRLLDGYALGKSDFNDSILAELCRTRCLKLVTNDEDFGQYDIPVLTANRRLLA